MFNRSEGGFSLLETLIALVLLAMISSILMRFSISQFRLVDKTNGALVDATDNILARDQFSTVVKGIVPAWPEDEKNRFRGTEDSFSGLTVGVLDSPYYSLGEFSFVVEDGRLIFNSSESSFDIYDFDQKLKFQYLGYKGNWSSKWPTDEAQNFHELSSQEKYVPRTIPRAIKIQLDQNDSAIVEWIVALDWESSIIPRIQDYVVD